MLPNSVLSSASRGENIKLSRSVKWDVRRSWRGGGGGERVAMLGYVEVLRVTVRPASVGYLSALHFRQEASCAADSCGGGGGGGGSRQGGRERAGYQF